MEGRLIYVMDLLSALLLAVIFKKVAGLLKGRFGWNTDSVLGLVSVPVIYLFIYFVVHPSLSKWF